MSRSGRGILVGIACLLFLSFLRKEAAAWPWTYKTIPRVELEDILKRPDAYLGQTVLFRGRFALRGNLFKHFHTEFTPERHVNIALWPLTTKLWDEGERRNVVPTVYILKENKRAMTALKEIRTYDVVEIEGEVKSSYSGIPWILITNLKKLVGTKLQISPSAIHSVKQGLELMEKKEYDLAIQQFEAALQAGIPEAHEPFIHKQIGQCRMKLEEAKQAAAAFTAATKVGKVEKPETLAQAISIKSKEMGEKTREKWTEWRGAGNRYETMDAEKDAGTHLQLARSYLQDRNADAAIASSKRALELAPYLSEAYAIMGEAYALRGEFQPARDACRTAALLPNASPAEKAMAEVRLAHVEIAARRFTEAAHAYARAVGEGSPLQTAPWLRKEIGKLYESRYDATGKPELLATAEQEYSNASVLSRGTDVEALYLGARAALKRTKLQETPDYSAVKEKLAACLAIQPEYGPAKVLQAEIALAENRPDEARKLLDTITAEDHQNNADAQLTLAQAYEKMGEKEKAREIYARVLQLDPSRREALERHAELSEAAGDLASARNDLTALATLIPSDLVYRLRLGKILLALGERDAAATQLSYATQSPGQQGEDASILLATIRLSQGRTADAESILRSILTANPNQDRAAILLANLLSDEKRGVEEAKEWASRVLTRKPDDLEALDALGWAEMALGKPTEALAIFHRIPEDKRTRRMWYHLGAVCAQLQDLAGATHALEKASAPLTPEENAPEAPLILEKAKMLLNRIRLPESTPPSSPAPESKPNKTGQVPPDVRSLRWGDQKEENQPVKQREIPNSLSSPEEGSASAMLGVQEEIQKNEVRLSEAITAREISSNRREPKAEIDPSLLDAQGREHADGTRPSAESLNKTLNSSPSRSSFPGDKEAEGVSPKVSGTSLSSQENRPPWWRMPHRFRFRQPANPSQPSKAVGEGISQKKTLPPDSENSPVTIEETQNPETSLSLSPPTSQGDAGAVDLASSIETEEVISTSHPTIPRPFLPTMTPELSDEYSSLKGDWILRKNTVKISEIPISEKERNSLPEWAK